MKTLNLNPELTLTMGLESLLIGLLIITVVCKCVQYRFQNIVSYASLKILQM